VDFLDCLRERRAAALGRFSVVLFWIVFGAVLAISLEMLVREPDTSMAVITVGSIVGLVVGLFAALGESKLALVLAFPAIIFWLVR
jgi:uncharacterized membrane protein YjfL (UPF0719 family)